MKRKRSDSASALVELMQDASLPPFNPPHHVNLRDADYPFWYSIVSAKARSAWNDSDLEIAGTLARCKADIERVQNEIDGEGDIVKNERGTPIMNPKHSLLECLARRCVALSRVLQVHPEATQGKARDQVKRNQAAADAGVASNSSDDLIARPQAH